MPENLTNPCIIPHECDLFLMSSHNVWTANHSLDSFARRGSRNVDGWGVGYYRNGTANILKSEIAATNNGDITREFNIAMNAISSETILGHLRLTSRGGTTIDNNHPFKLNFLNYDWLMIHNGTGQRINNLIPYQDQLLVNSTNDSARAFEFLRREIISYYYSDPKKSLIEAVRYAYSKLLEEDPAGSYNMILSNGYINWCFIHWRPFYLLHREKEPGNVALVSTIRLTDDEDWIEFDKSRSKKARMIVFSGNSLILNGDVPK